MKIIRKSVGPVIWMMVAALVIWSVQGIFTSLSGSARGVGKAFGKIVAFKEYDDAFKSTELLVGRGSDSATPDINELREAAWQHLIFSREALRERIEVTDSEVISEIGKFLGGKPLSNQDYNQLIRRNFNEHPRNFEERIRTILRIRKLYEKHQQVTASATAEEVNQFYLNDRNKIAVDYIQLKSENEAKEFKNRVTDLTAWNAEKQKEDRKIGSLGPVNVDIFMTVLGISQSDVNSLLALNPADLSEIVTTKTGYAIFNVTQKETVSLDGLDEAKRKDYEARLIEQKKQTAFTDWMSDVIRRANVEKFQAAASS